MLIETAQYIYDTASKNLGSHQLFDKTNLNLTRFNIFKTATLTDDRISDEELVLVERKVIVPKKNEVVAVLEIEKALQDLEIDILKYFNTKFSNYVNECCAEVGTQEELSFRKLMTFTERLARLHTPKRSVTQVYLNPDSYANLVIDTDFQLSLDPEIRVENVSNGIMEKACGLSFFVNTFELYKAFNDHVILGVDCKNRLNENYRLMLHSSVFEVPENLDRENNIGITLKVELRYSLDLEYGKNLFLKIPIQKKV